MPVRILEPRRPDETEEQFEARRDAYYEMVKEDEAALQRLRDVRAERSRPQPRRRGRW